MVGVNRLTIENGGEPEMAIIDQADQAFNQQFTIKNGTSTIRNEFFGFFWADWDDQQCR